MRRPDTIIISKPITNTNSTYLKTYIQLFVSYFKLQYCRTKRVHGIYNLQILGGGSCFSARPIGMSTLFSFVRSSLYSSQRYLKHIWRLKKKQIYGNKFSSSSPPLGDATKTAVTFVAMRGFLGILDMLFYVT